MNKHKKLIEKILLVKSDSNINFQELVNLLIFLGFEMRIKGDHHIFFKQGVEEIINIQPIRKLAKNYQVKQIRKFLLKNQNWDE
jgi:predicted RNA binding protein YcfA (HicA-like mRNA interferase family)